MSKRKRRSAEESRKRILDAAQERLIRTGPAGLRLQDVAKDVGLSHPGVLHHFGSREALVDAVTERGLRNLQAGLLDVLLNNERSAESYLLLEEVYQALDNGDNAHLLAWLIMSQPKGQPYGDQRLLKVIANAVQYQQTGTHEASEQTRFTILLVALSLFSDAIAGTTMRHSLGLSGDGSKFRQWLSNLISDLLKNPESS